MSCQMPTLMPVAFVSRLKCHLRPVRRNCLPVVTASFAMASMDGSEVSTDRLRQSPRHQKLPRIPNAGALRGGLGLHQHVLGSSCRGTSTATAREAAPSVSVFRGVCGRARPRSDIAGARRRSSERCGDERGRSVASKRCGRGPSAVRSLGDLRASGDQVERESCGANIARVAAEWRRTGVRRLLLMAMLGTAPVCQPGPTCSIASSAGPRSPRCGVRGYDAPANPRPPDIRNGAPASGPA